MGYRTTNGLSDYNLYKLKEEAVNNGKAIWRSTITVDGNVQTLATDLAAIAAKGLPSPIYAEFDVISDELTDVVARYTIEGTTPVATTTGIPLYNKDLKIIQEYYNLQRFRITQEAANTTTIEVTYFKL